MWRDEEGILIRVLVATSKSMVNSSSVFLKDIHENMESVFISVNLLLKTILSTYQHVFHWFKVVRSA